DAPRSLPPGSRWIGWLVVLAVVAGLVAFAAIQSDGIARNAAAGTVRSAVVSSLQLPDTQEVDVDFGGGLFFLQALRGTINSVDITISGVLVGEATADLELTGTGVPLEPGAPLDTLTSRIRIDAANLMALGAYISSAPLTGVSLGGETVSVSTDIDAAGTPTPVSVGLAPSTAGGRVLFTPVTVGVAGAESTAEEALAGPLAPFLGPLLTSPSWCAAQYLPKSLAVSGAAVVDNSFVVTATGNGVPLTGAALTEKGVCEG
ncbi:MAG: hypothetical protein JWM51_1806, partial [Microbacteriaceae bacterium]|nr:hypothetical protein [Microbacteriaceae bacterium]